MEVFNLKTGSGTSLEDITATIRSIVRNSDVREGICCVFIPHTTAGVTINENADPAVKSDMIMELDKIVPLQDGYAHIEGNSAAHVKSSITGHSVSIPVSNGDLCLGTWQGIYFCEFDGPRKRKVQVVVK